MNQVICPYGNNRNLTDEELYLVKDCNYPQCGTDNRPYGDCAHRKIHKYGSGCGNNPQCVNILNLDGSVIIEDFFNEKDFEI